MTTPPFDHQVIFITGASSGLGRALAIALSKQGAKLVLIARNRAKLEETQSLLSDPLSSFLVTADVTKPDDCARAFSEGVEKFGRIDSLLLCAGISMWTRFDQIQDPTILQKIMETNYLGAVYCTYYALPHLKKTGGMIVPISSIQGKIAVPYHTGYAASKHAIQGFFDSLRSELPHEEVAILIISPSWIQGTALREQALESQCREQTHRGISLERCCEEIMRAISQKKRELILPLRYGALPWLRLFFPETLRRFIHRAIEKKMLNISQS